MGCLVGWLCLTSHRQRGHLEMAPLFTIPCDGREAQLIHRSDQELNHGPSHDSPLRYRRATQAPHCDELQRLGSVAQMGSHLIPCHKGKFVGRLVGCVLHPINSKVI